MGVPGLPSVGPALVPTERPYHGRATRPSRWRACTLADGHLPRVS